MDMYSLLIQNREVIKIFYSLIILFICVIIVFKTDRISILSSHQGIRNFRNAFFFYGVAFTARYIIGSQIYGSNIHIVLFEFFLIVAGLYLLNSILWRKFYHIERKYYSSLLTPISFLFYGVAFILVFLDWLWGSYLFLFISQVFIFSIAAILSYKNYLKQRGKLFPKFYFVAMFLSLVAWILNALAALILNWNKLALTGVYILNIIVFLLFLYGVNKLIKN